MAIGIKKKDEKIEYKVTVDKAIECKNGSILVDLDVNGVKIYSCFYKVITKKDGSQQGIIDFPQHKGADDKYYKYAYFFISPEQMEDIESQIESKLNAGK